MTKAYHNGPIDDDQRKRTDIVCLIIFLVFNVVMFGIAVYSWTNSKFSKLTTPYDPDGKGCGVDYPDYPFIYFASPHRDSLFVTTCVKKCPIQTDTLLECKTNSVVTSCTPSNSADNTKAVQIYDTTSVRGIICMPTSTKIQAQIYQALGAEGTQQKLTTLKKTWVVILISIPLSIILAILFMLLMRITAGFFVYLLLALSIISLLAFGLYLLVAPQTQYVALASTLTQNQYLSKIVAVVCIILGILIAIMAVCFRKRLTLASSIVKVSSRFVQENCPVMLLQFILFVVMILFVALWIVEALGFYSLGQPTQEKNTLPFQHFKSTTAVKALGFLHIFYLFWGMLFLVHTGDFIVAGTVTSWYFQRQTPYKQSAKRYAKYHMGSVCLGSFLIAFLGFIKFMYEVLTPEKADEQGCLKSWKKFCDCCCILCVKWLFDCLNSGAYTFIHLSSDSYCSSAVEVIAIRIRDIVISAVVLVLDILFQIIIRVGITALTLLVAYIILKNAQPYKSQVNDPIMTLAVVGLIGFTISSFFVSLYAQAMQAISLCYLIDKEAGGGQDKCPDELKNFLTDAKVENHTLME